MFISLTEQKSLFFKAQDDRKWVENKRQQLKNLQLTGAESESKEFYSKQCC